MPYEMGDRGGAILSDVVGGVTDSSNLTGSSGWRTLQVINDAVLTTFTSTIENGDDIEDLTLPAGLVINCEHISAVVLDSGTVYLAV